MSKFYYYYSNKNKIVKSSSSGGVFFDISSAFIKKYNAVVYGVALVNGDFIHTRVDSVKSLKPLMRSKYVKAKIRNSFIDCYNDLKNQRVVLYVGLPCEVFALKTYLSTKNANMEKIFFVDLVCHGVPSHQTWDQYIKEKFPSQKLLSVNFREKKLGWGKYFIHIKTDKNNYVSFKLKDEYMRAFSSSYSLLPSCYACKNKGDNRASDITIGDFWNISKYSPKKFNKKGTSVIVIHNEEKAKELCSILTITGHLTMIDYDICYDNPSYYFSSKIPENYDEYCNILKTKGFLAAVNHITIPKNYSLLIKIKNKIKSFRRGKING